MWHKFERDGRKYEIAITQGYVGVRVPLFDCEGVQRAIYFPRCGNGGFVISGNPLMHWTSKPYVREALKVAKTAIADYEHARKRGHCADANPWIPVQ